MHPDQYLLEGLVTNDVRIIQEIYKRYASETSAFVISNNGTEEDARDVFQEALMTILRQARERKLQLTCSFGGYLYIVVRGKWLNELKKRKRTPVTINEPERWSNEAGENEVFLAEQTLNDQKKSDLFWKMFENLGERCRELLKLSWGGQSMEEVSGIMGVSYGYARKKKSECISRLVKLVRESREFVLLTAETR